MKKILFLLGCYMVITSGTIACANSLDLTTFLSDSGVTESAGLVTFQESFEAATVYFYNDAFLVPGSATTLSFNYDFLLGDNDYDDHFTFDLNFSSAMDEYSNTANGFFSIDLSPYRNQEISLAWGLIWGGDDSAGTTANVYNINLDEESGNPVPEPGSLILLGFGLVGLAGLRRKRLSRKS